MTTSLVALGVAGALTPACLSRPIEPIEPRRTSTLVEQFTQSKVDKIDILLAIDDSGSMADKQAILAVAVPDLIEELVNPACVDDSGVEVAQPEGPLDECPPDSRREFEPVLDIHIGVISTSLGPRGSTMPAGACPDDSAHLLTRTLDEQGVTGEMTTWDDLGFLAWDPAEERDPKGHTDAQDLAGVSGLRNGEEHSPRRGKARTAPEGRIR